MRLWLLNAVTLLAFWVQTAEGQITAHFIYTDPAISGGMFRTGSAPSPDGPSVYVFNTSSTASTVEVFDGPGGTLDRTINLGDWHHRCAGVVVGNHLYSIANWIISVIDRTSESEIATIPFPSAGGIVAGSMVASADGDHVYAVAGFAESLLVVDTATIQLAESVYIGNEYTGLALSPDGTRVYASDRLTGTLQIIDAACIDTGI